MCPQNQSIAIRDDIAALSFSILPGRRSFQVFQFPSIRSDSELLYWNESAFAAYVELSKSKIILKKTSRWTRKTLKNWDNWIKEHGVRHSTNWPTWLNKDEVKWLQIIARRYGEQSEKRAIREKGFGRRTGRCAFLWYYCLANQTGVDLQAAFDARNGKKNTSGSRSRVTVMKKIKITCSKNRQPSRIWRSVVFPSASHLLYYSWFFRWFWTGSVSNSLRKTIMAVDLRIGPWRICIWFLRYLW